MTERDRGKRGESEEGQPTGEPGPSNPDDAEPSEEDAKRKLPGVPEEATDQGSD